MSKPSDHPATAIAPPNGAAAPAHEPNGFNRPSEDEPTVYIVEDDSVLRSTLELLLSSCGARVKVFSSGREFLDSVSLRSPACIVMDIRMPDATGLEVQEELARRGIGTPIIFLTGYGTVPASVRAMKAGAVDFLSKPVDENALMEAVYGALNRDRIAGVTRARVRALQERFAMLSPREQQVMQLVILGRLNKQIAHAMNISEKTVKVHRGKVMQKMGATFPSRNLSEWQRCCASMVLSDRHNSSFTS